MNDSATVGSDHGLGLLIRHCIMACLLLKKAYDYDGQHENEVSLPEVVCLVHDK